MDSSRAPARPEYTAQPVAAVDESFEIAATPREYEEPNFELWQEINRLREDLQRKDVLIRAMDLQIYALQHQLTVSQQQQAQVITGTLGMRLVRSIQEGRSV